MSNKKFKKNSNGENTVKVSGVVDPDQFVSNMEASFKHKFATKPQVVAGNMTVLTQSMEEVQEG